MTTVVAVRGPLSWAALRYENRSTRWIADVSISGRDEKDPFILVENAWNEEAFLRARDWERLRQWFDAAPPGVEALVHHEDVLAIFEAIDKAVEVSNSGLTAWGRIKNELD